MMLKDGSSVNFQAQKVGFFHVSSLVDCHGWSPNRKCHHDYGSSGHHHSRPARLAWGLGGLAAHPRGLECATPSNCSRMICADNFYDADGVPTRWSVAICWNVGSFGGGINGRVEEVKFRGAMYYCVWCIHMEHLFRLDMRTSMNHTNAERLPQNLVLGGTFGRKRLKNCQF